MFLALLPVVIDSQNLIKIRERIENIREIESFDISELSPILHPLLALKIPEFYEKFTENSASSIPNVTTECFEDLFLVGLAILSPNTTSPEFAAVYSQSKSLRTLFG